MKEQIARIMTAKKVSQWLVTAHFQNLTHEQALEYLKEGRPVKLPEWDGFWFPIKDKIMVFTKDGEILDTPHHDVYGERKDWTTVIPLESIPVRFVKVLRTRIDTIISHIKADVSPNRETSLAYTSGQLGFMWLGLFLGDLGAANPYPKSMDASSPQIEKHADKAEGDYLTTPDWAGLDETAKVKSLRLELQKHIDYVEFIGKFARTKNQPWAVAIDKLIEAKLWLGQQLNNIRVAQEANS